MRVFFAVCLRATHSLHARLHVGCLSFRCCCPVVVLFALKLEGIAKCSAEEGTSAARTGFDGFRRLESWLRVTMKQTKVKKSKRSVRPEKPGEAQSTRRTEKTEAGAASKAAPKEAGRGFDVAYEFRTGIPLGVVVFRYFVYVLLGLALVCGCVFASYAATVRWGVVYRAGYAADTVDELASTLKSQPTFDQSVVSSAFWYAHLTADATLLQSDMNVEQMTHAREMVTSGQTASTYKPAGVFDSTFWFKTITLSDGSKCVLAYTMDPQFVDRGLRDSMPNPEIVAIAACACAAVIVIVAIASRASRVISRKMDPLVCAVHRIEQHDFNFEVHAGNVRQINNVLGAVERMRVSLKESLVQLPSHEALEAQEPQGQVAQEPQGQASLPSQGQTDSRGSQDSQSPQGEQSTRLQQESIPRIEQASIPSSQGAPAGSESAALPLSSAGQFQKACAAGSIDIAEFSYAVEDAARKLASAAGVRLHVRATKSFAAAAASGLEVAWDGEAAFNAVMSLVLRACANAPKDTIVQLSFGFARRGQQTLADAIDNRPLASDSDGFDDELCVVRALKTNRRACSVIFSVKDEGPCLSADALGALNDALAFENRTSGGVKASLALPLG